MTTPPPPTINAYEALPGLDNKGEIRGISTIVGGTCCLHILVRARDLI